MVSAVVSQVSFLYVFAACWLSVAVVFECPYLQQLVHLMMPGKNGSTLYLEQATFTDGEAGHSQENNEVQRDMGFGWILQKFLSVATL